MNKGEKPLRWLSKHIIFLSIACFVLCVKLAPLSPLMSIWSAPHIVICVILFWVIHRPSDLPLLSIFAVLFLFDVVLEYPIGLLSGCMVIATEALRARTHYLFEQSFLVECLVGCGIILAITSIQFITLKVFLVPSLQAQLSLAQGLLTVLFYPLCAGIGRLYLYIRQRPIYMPKRRRGRS